MALSLPLAKSELTCDISHYLDVGIFYIYKQGVIE